MIQSTGRNKVALGSSASAGVGQAIVRQLPKDGCIASRRRHGKIPVQIKASYQSRPKPGRTD